MRLQIEKSPRQISIHIIWGLFIIGGLIMARILHDYVGLVPSCIFRTITGIPCLTCGGTHCLVALSNISITGSFLSNPLIFIMSVVLISSSIVIFLGWLLKKKIVLYLTPLENKILRIAILTIVVANWIYLIVCL